MLDKYSVIDMKDLYHRLPRSIPAFAILAIAIMLVAGLQPTIDHRTRNSGDDDPTNQEPFILTTETASDLDVSGGTRGRGEGNPIEMTVDALIEACDNMTDTDGDGLPDSVEAVLGTNFNSTDTDSDGLPDNYELRTDLDPLEMDSNDDGMADYTEIISVPTLLSSSWEENDPSCDPQFHSSDDVSAAWNSSSTGNVHQGMYSFQFSGSFQGDTDDNDMQWYVVKLFDVDFEIGADTRLSYWIYHDNTTVRRVSIDGICTDGSSIRNIHDDGIYVTDQYEVRAHPAYRKDPDNVWYHVEFDLSLLKGKTLDYLTLNFDVHDAQVTGTFRTFIDELAIWENDIDGDGSANAWDDDNDGDGVPDKLDLSPFTRSTENDEFTFNIKTGGNPTYLDFQMRSANPDHLNLPGQTWDWPSDYKGQMQDIDNSKDDVRLTPMLEIDMGNGPFMAQSEVSGYGIAITDDRYYKIVNRNSGKCLDVESSSEEEGGNIHQWEYHGHDNQKWKLVPAGGACYEIINVNSGKCLDVKGKSKETGANIHQWECHGHDNQKWKLEPVGDGYYKITNVNSGKCVDVQGGSKDDGANIHQWEYKGHSNQKWRIEPVGGDILKIINENSGKCLDVESYNMADGANIQQWEYKGHDNQKWKAEPVGDGYYKIINERSGKCVDVEEGSPSDGGNIHQWEYLGHDNQKWNVEPVGDGCYKIINANSGKCVDVQGKSKDDGANIHQWEYEGHSNQKWKLEPVEGLMKAFVPLMPIQDLGTTVALQGRMFYPASVPLDLLASAKLVWMVNGKTDKSDLSWSPTKYRSGLGGFNAGGGAAIADINGNGKPDLLLMGIDDPKGENSFWYKIGWDLNADGDPTNGWSSTKYRSGLGGSNAGGGAAIADLNGNGKLDLLLMGIDDPKGGNSFWYKIGWDIHADGDPTNGWSSTIQSPDIGSRFNAGGGAAIADINGNGIPDLLLMAIDAPDGANQYRHMIGWDLDAEGTPTSWTSTVKSGNIGRENDGGGAAITDIEGDGSLDVLFMGIDDPKGSNSFWYEIGRGIESRNAILARYHEGFMLTGFSIEENFGSEVGVVYSEDINQTLRAYVALRYEFQNSNISMTSAFKKLAEHNISVTSLIDHGTHLDQVLIETKTQIEKVLQNLPYNTDLPVALALEERTVTNGMDEFVSRSYVLGETFSVDIVAAHQVTTRSIKLPWFNTKTRETVDLDGILTFLKSLDWNEGDMANVSLLLLYWIGGETTITQIDSYTIEYHVETEEEILAEIGKNIDVLDFLRCNLRLPVKSVVFLGIAGPVVDVAWATFEQQSKILRDQLTYLAKTPKEKFRVIYYNTLNNADRINTFNPTRRAIRELPKLYGKDSRPVAKMSRMSGRELTRGLRALGRILIVITVLMIVAEFLVTAWKLDWSASGFAMGASIAVLEMIYLGIIVALSLIPAVGWVITIVLLLIDLVASFFGKGSGWIIEKIVGALTDYKLRSKVDLEMKGSMLDIMDYDDNGLTVGDRIVLRSTIIERITKTDRGSHDDVMDSYITPGYSANIIGNSGKGDVFHHTLYHVEHDSWREYGHDIGLWVEPKRSMINYPIWVYLSADYKVYYDECFCGICSRKSHSGTQENPAQTFYFDVLPGTLDDFLDWDAITRNDNDGDGLTNVVEKGNDATGNYYGIINNNSGMCLDVQGGGDADGANIHQWGYKGHDNQIWELEPAEDGYFAITNKHSGKCMDVEEGSTEDGGNIHQWEYKGHDNQEWELEPVGNGYYNIINRNSGKCVDVQGKSTEDGANIHQWEYKGHDNQKWKLEPAETSTDKWKWDSDGDGLSDGFEVNSVVDYGTDPARSDTDGDGLNDAKELRIGTSPIRADTDGDGLTDYGEYRGWQIDLTYCGQSFTTHVWSDPISNDTDLDGLKDHEEYQRGLNPRSNDTDGDGILDADESIISRSGGRPYGADLTRSDSLDSDSDGLSDESEAAGRLVFIFDASGSHTVQVTSDPLLPDTDFDGLDDSLEFTLGSNPRDVDTDGDGLSDRTEKELGMNLSHHDIDGDGLDDGVEATFGSDPWSNDTDSDGLSDHEEFGLGSDPASNDTDRDGLEDSVEALYNSNLVRPDSDEDLLFDNMEYLIGTDPNHPDSDDDGHHDGYEYIMDMDPLSNDTDGDGVSDGDELELHMNPLSNDTDGDGLDDLRELELGTNPVSGDTDRDGVGDAEDHDSYTEHVEHVILVFDAHKDTYEFADRLSAFVNVTVVTPDELLRNHSNAQHIVIVGRPYPGNDTAGNLSYTLLKDTGEILTDMQESDYDRLAVGYGIWNSTQTIVMLSHPYHSDHWRVLSILKSTNVMIQPDSVYVEYPSPRDYFTVEAIKEIDSFIWVDLERSVTPTVEMTRYNSSTTPFALDHALGMMREEEAVGRYLEIIVSENVQNETGDIINWAHIIMYYTAWDLDRTGDGDANDTDDVNETALSVYYFDESSDDWMKLSVELDWVFDIKVNTTNREHYGKEYEGEVMLNVSRLLLFGLAGKIHQIDAEEEDDKSKFILWLLVAVLAVLFIVYFSQIFPPFKKKDKTR